MYVLSHFQARSFLGKDIKVSLDLGRTYSEVSFTGGRYVLPDGQTLGESDITKILKKAKQCFRIEDSQAVPITLFSPETNNFYKLVPTGVATAPTLEISGIKMHVTKSMDALTDAERKVGFLKSAQGRLLDTCTGLGYTAIAAAKRGFSVTTFEIDENIIELQNLNPWSRELFTSLNITRMEGDIAEEITKLEDRSFDAVTHDPPRYALAPALYSLPFYKELARITKKGGSLFHYTGEPGRTKGEDIRKGVIARLAKAGYTKLEKVFNGVTAQLP